MLFLTSGECSTMTYSTALTAVLHNTRWGKTAIALGILPMSDLLLESQYYFCL